MRTFILSIASFLILSNASAQVKTGFGGGYYRISYVNVYNCTVEIQSFDSLITDKILRQAMPYFYHIGAKDGGMENEFKTYQSYDYAKKSDTKAKQAAFSKEQYAKFQKSVKKLSSAPVPKEFEAYKMELLKNHTNKLKFENIFKDWYANGKDDEFRKRITEFYSDVYIVATLDKTLALKDINDKMRYTYAELYDIVNAKVFSYEKLNEMQNKLFFDLKIDIEFDPKCKKS